TMSPGEYEVQLAPGSALANESFYIMSLRNRSGRDYKAVATGLALPGASVTRPELAFQRYGNRAFLTALRTPSLQIGMPISKAEAQREIAKQYEEQEVVTLFLRADDGCWAYIAGLSKHGHPGICVWPSCPVSISRRVSTPLECVLLLQFL